MSEQQNTSPLEDDDAFAWLDRAACADVRVQEFFLEGYQSEVLAKCETCPVRVPCLTYALTTPHPHGVFGGTTGAQRQRHGMELLPS